MNHSSSPQKHSPEASDHHAVTAPKSNFSTMLTTGMAMFSMFFGAGNVVFPLAIGAQTGDQHLAASLGLWITAVIMPFLGLLSMMLYQGDYHAFFGRLGKRTGLLIAALIMGLIGPFGALPRTISLSFATTKMFIPGLNVEFFSMISVLIIFLCTVRRSRIVDLIGTWLTPILLGSLAIIIVVGLYLAPPIFISITTPFNSFLNGLQEGYMTMDLLGAFFFSGVVIQSLKEEVKQAHDLTPQHILKSSSQASLVGGSLLTVVYLGFSTLAARYGAILAGISPDQYLGTLAHYVLGPWAGLVASIAVALACLTTAIALAAVFAHFLKNDILKGKLSYPACLVLTLITTYFVSTLEFKGIVALLILPLQIIYPSLIVLALCNASHKIWHTEETRRPVMITFFATLLYMLFTRRVEWLGYLFT